MGSHSAGPIPSVSHKPVFSSFGAVGPPKKVVLPEETCYTLFGDDAHNNSFFPLDDFTRDNKFHDDPRLSHICGGLMGPDGAPLRPASVEDGDVRDGIIHSVTSQVRFSLGCLDVFPSTSAAVSSCGDSVAFADDSGTEYTLMTLSTGSKWDGKALAVLDVIGAGGRAFKAYGGDCMIVHICDIDNVWREVNLGLGFISPDANLDLASSHQMQLHNLGSIFEYDGNAYIESRGGHKFPLYRHGGLWKFDVRFMNPNGASASDSAYRAACDAALESSMIDLPRSARAMSVVSPFFGDIRVPGVFANASPCCSVHGSSNSPSHMFANVSKCASCTSCHHRVTGCCGSVSADMLIHGIELSLPSNIQMNDDNAARIMQRVANMKMYHVLYKHANVEFLNKLVRENVIKDGILLDSISCAHCASSKMRKANVSKT